MKTYKHYINILKKSYHILIAGSTGGGKSVLLNNLIYTNLLIRPHDQYIFIDPKKIELIQYRNIKQCYYYTDTAAGAAAVLNSAINTMNYRYKIMQYLKIKEYGGGRLYIIIDELADLMTAENKKEIKAYLQKILQLGRAARVYVIACTQSIHHSIIETYIKINFNTIISLKVRNKKDSILILDRAGAESLPLYGKMIILNNSNYTLYNNYMIPQNNINKLIQQNKRKSILQQLFK